MTAHASPEGFSGALSFLGDRCPVQMRKDTPRAFYASCAKAGLTVAQTARLGMVTYQAAKDFGDRHDPVSYTHLTLPTIHVECRSRWSPYH